MKGKYQIGSSYLLTVKEVRYVEIADLLVHPCERRVGIAKELLGQVCQDADDERTILVLDCAPDDDVISFNDCRALYERYGFVLIGVSRMIRKPNVHQ